MISEFGRSGRRRACASLTSRALYQVQDGSMYKKLEGGRGLAENDGIRGIIIIMGGSMINRATIKVVVVLGSRRLRFYVLHFNLFEN